MRELSPFPRRSPAAFTGRARWVVYAILLGVWLSGAGWLVIDRFLRHRDELGFVAPSPLTPWARDLHGAFAFASLALLGWLIGVHVPPGWRLPRWRPSGIAMLTISGVLVVTGYLLYYAAGDATRAAVSTVHWAVGLGTPVLWWWHRGRRRPRDVSK